MTADLLGHDPNAITRQDKIAELKRELHYRRFVYPKLVGSGKLTQAKMDRQIAIVEAIIKDYESGAIPG